MEVKIEKLNHSGEGIGHIDGKIVFVPKTLPGDIVDVVVVKEYKNYLVARVDEYVELSKERVEIKCPYYFECGGCQLMGLDYQRQLDYKREKVSDILEKYAGLKFNPSIKGSEMYQYRNKITIQVKEGQMGLFNLNSNDLVSIDRCLLVSDNINRLIGIIKDNLDLSGIKQIVIREAKSGVMVKFVGEIDRSILGKKILPNVISLYLNEEFLGGDKSLVDTLGDYQFLVSPNSFFQVNHEQTINLYDQVKKYLGNSNGSVMDLYCGTGSIGIYVSDCCKRVDGIELNSSSVRDAYKNIELNNLDNVFVSEGDVGKVLKSQDGYEAVIVDPPRSGLDKRTRETLLRMKCPKVIYISCNPMTLARDLNDLKEIYNIEDVTLFDMFPNTYHVESILLLSRK